MKLGLIGDNIAASQAPRLHRIAGALAGLSVTYDRLVPKDMGLSAREILAQVQADGFQGVNVTYPYKSVLAGLVEIDDPFVRQMGAINTVRFGDGVPQGFNTDYSGFVRAFKAGLARPDPGTVCLIGAGGAGSAVAFGLVTLGAHEIRVVDQDPQRAQVLADSLRGLSAATRIHVVSDATLACVGADGIVNCTPLGMGGIGGTPIAKTAMTDATWAFDAVYTPVETEFLANAAEQGLDVLSGYELFFGQGVDAWRIFSGRDVDEAALRAQLMQKEAP